MVTQEQSVADNKSVDLLALVQSATKPYGYRAQRIMGDADIVEIIDQRSQSLIKIEQVQPGKFECRTQNDRSLELLDSVDMVEVVQTILEFQDAKNMQSGLQKKSGLGMAAALAAAITGAAVLSSNDDHPAPEQPEVRQDSLIP